VLVKNVEIVYCCVCHDTQRAIGAMAERLEGIEELVESVRLIPSNDGRFDVTVGGHLLYS